MGRRALDIAAWLLVLVAFVALGLMVVQWAAPHATPTPEQQRATEWVNCYGRATPCP